jgi:dynein heavy chain
MLEVVSKLDDRLETLQQALEEYLETKRRIFPRLYFVSNDDLLEMLAHSKRPELIQPHIKKLFLNIKSLKLGKVLPACCSLDLSETRALSRIP